ncbi:hypothetical protein O4H62_21650 [Hoeflea alexandrii]|nr:hypothetical protein [Hoeflea alexandrii]
MNAALDGGKPAAAKRTHGPGSDAEPPANCKILQSAVKLLAFEHVGRNHAGNSKNYSRQGFSLFRKPACRVALSRWNEEEVKSLRE